MNGLVQTTLIALTGVLVGVVAERLIPRAEVPGVVQIRGVGPGLDGQQENCSTGCVIKVMPDYDDDGDSCKIGLSANVAQVGKQQAVYWVVDAASAPGAEFAPRGIVIDGNRAKKANGKPIKNRPFYECGMAASVPNMGNVASGVAFYCLRKSASQNGAATGDEQEDRMRAFSYTVHLKLKNNRPCYFDPIIVSRD